MNRNSLTFAILGLLLLLQGGNLLYAVLIKYATAVAKMSLLFKTGLYGMVLGGIYYFAAIFSFFIQPQTSEPGVAMIAGRPFQVGRSLKNPANHIIASSLLLFVSFGLLFSAWVLN